jgi:hypothetical protein
MDEQTRRILEMGQRALEFCKAHPDSSPGYNAAVARLEKLLARAEELRIEVEKEEAAVPIPSRSEAKGKVLPFRRPSQSDPTDPAA